MLQLKRGPTPGNLLKSSGDPNIIGRVRCRIIYPEIRDMFGDIAYTNFTDYGEGTIECYIPEMGFVTMSKSEVMECDG